MRKKSQSIIVTGESGAGKTEASKLVMNFLTSVNQVSSSSSSVAVVIKTIILESNAIFEAFGNAKTVRNDNSSRFGKYIKLQYTAENELWAAHTETFLLEKSRLVSVGKDDRNYHIFYQLIHGLRDTALRQKLKLTSVADFKILTSSGGVGASAPLNVESEEELRQQEEREFAAVERALRDMNCCREEEVAGLWSLLAAILHMGNIKTTDNPHHNHHHNNSSDSSLHHVNVESPSLSLKDIAGLLGLSDQNQFLRALSTQHVKISSSSLPSSSQQQQTPREFFERRLSADDTRNNVLALIKWVYGGIFNWLVNRINSSSSSSSSSKSKTTVKFIGILDIFGFEVLAVNTFEQLCINYTNERLQQQFNELAFEIEQRQYASEGLDWTAITYRDNQSVLDLIARRPRGLLLVLEEHSLMNREPDDKALLSAFNNLHATSNLAPHPNYMKSRFGNDGFVIKHFAGDVHYAIAHFLVKNNDSLQEDLAALLATSTNTLLLDILQVDAQVAAEAWLQGWAMSVFIYCIHT
jgi:myosin heavy subunit